MLDSGISSISGRTILVAPVDKAANSASSERQDVPESGKVSPQQPDSEAAAMPQKTKNEVLAFAQTLSTHLRFEVDDSTGSSIITVMDRETDEIIRQVPLEAIAAVSRFITNYTTDPVVGLLMDHEG